jgi:predicted aconitase with swiveling domain
LEMVSDGRSDDKSPVGGKKVAGQILQIEPSRVSSAAF